MENEENKIEIENEQNKVIPSISPEIQAYLDAKKASEDAMKKENEKREKAIAEARSAIEKLDLEMANLNEQIASLSQKKSILLDLLGMGSSNNSVRGHSSHQYRYAGMLYNSASELCAHLPNGKEVRMTYSSIDWVNVIQSIKNGRVPPRIIPFTAFVDAVKNVEIL